MSTTVEFTYRLTGTGWSDAQLRVGDSSAPLSASYLGDALGELLDALVALIDGALSARASWDEEPGEYRWLFDRDGWNIRIRLLDFPELRGFVEAPDEEGTVLLDERCDLEGLVAAIASAARAVLSEYGAEGYREKWVEHDFPATQLERLEAWLHADRRA